MDLRGIISILILLSFAHARAGDSLPGSYVLYQSSSIIDPFRQTGGACFSHIRKEADGCTQSDWLKKSLVDRAKFIHDKYAELTKAHNIPFSPRVLTCKAMRESTFRSQDQAAPPGTVAGLSQISSPTAVDIFARAKWFKPKVEGFEAITDGTSYYEEMKVSPVAQLELGLAVLYQKSRDFKTKDIRSTLEKYYGSEDDCANTEYAEAIFDCAECMVQNRNRMTLSCLNKTKEKPKVRCKRGLS